MVENRSQLLSEETMSSTNNDFLNQLIATFRLEADEHLQTMVNGLLTLETATTPDEQRSIVETIFREAHSLKGAARAVDLTEIEAVCQALEGVFAQRKRQELSLAPADFDTVHRTLDTVSALLADPNQPHATQVTEVIYKLAQLETDGHQSISSLLIETKSASQALAETTLQVSPSAPPVEHNAS